MPDMLFIKKVKLSVLIIVCSRIGSAAQEEAGAGIHRRTNGIVDKSFFVFYERQGSFYFCGMKIFDKDF